MAANMQALKLKHLILLVVLQAFPNVSKRIRGEELAASMGTNAP